MKESMTSREIAVIVGAGPGLGASLARHFARAGMTIVLAARNKQRLMDLAHSIGPNRLPVECDATQEADVTRLFEVTMSEVGAPDLVVFNPSHYTRERLVDARTEDFEHAWRSSCLGGFLVGRGAARTMISAGRGGTILFTGSSASLHGIAEYPSFSAAKCALRGLAQSMARELRVDGIHVAHISIDGTIASKQDRAGSTPVTGIEPDAIANAFLELHRQERTRWTHEVELRPQASQPRKPG